MGARLVAASLPIYALAVALALFPARQVQENSWFWPMWYGGLVAVAALALLLAGGAAARAFDRGCVTIVGSVFLLVVVLLFGLAFAGQPTPLWVAVYVAPLLAVGFFIAHAVIARGLPNPPMAFASAPPLTLEYPADRADLAADAATYGARLALVVRRTGVVLPAQGVHVRYRWYKGPDDPAPPKGAVVVTLPAELMDWPKRADRFAERIATTLVPQPDWRVHDA